MSIGRVWLSSPRARIAGGALLASGALLAACGSDEGTSSAGGNTAPSAEQPGTALPPGGGGPGDDTASDSPPSNDGSSDGAAAPGASNEGVDPDLGLAPGADGSSGATDGADPAGGTNGTDGAGAEGSAPGEPTPGDPGNDPAPSDPSPDPAAPLTIFLAGDSIVQTYADTPSTTDQAGWGQMLREYFDASTTILNRAIGGRTARRFIDEGRLDEIVDELEPGDFLLVQFGTNDGNRTATYTLGGETIPYFLDPATDFRAYLQRYVDAARGRGANPVFVTPTPRNSAYCTGGNGTGAHAAAMSALGAEQGVPVVDLNARTVAFLRAICPAPTPEDFFLLRADGSVDGTHFQENGARTLAGFVADGLAALGGPLSTHRRAP